MHKSPSKQAFGPAINRIADVMAHTNLYAFKGISRLAADAGVSRAAVSRVINGTRTPSTFMIERLRRALEKELKRPLDPRDLVAENGKFSTMYVCEVVGCRGCLPANAHDEFGAVKAAFQGVKPGAWVTSRFPRGFQPVTEEV